MRRSTKAPEARPGVLLSWIAANRDPTLEEKGKTVQGPTWVLLCEPGSTWRGRITDAIMLHQPQTLEIAQRTEAHVRASDPSIQFHLRAWDGDDPTDHRQIFAFVDQQVRWARERFPERELVVHLSPGTPAMHAVWLLMAESGFIDPPFSVVQTVPSAFRRSGPPVIAASIGIDTFYKRYIASQPARVASPVERVRWSVERFQSPAMVEVRQAAKRYARLRAPVLILGERGTGKTQIAGWIRFQSPFRRSDRDESWPTVACGQYTPELMAAELFGYRKGAFTGANATRQGLLAAADGDTLFLDEIGDISRDVQRLLIRAVEEQTFQPLGSDLPCKSDFRLITATNLDASELRRRLTPDFLDRISYLTLRLPPLRELRPDLDWLWDEILRAAAASAQVGLTDLAPEVGRARLLAAVRAHPLPGNLRDLFRAAHVWLATRLDTSADAAVDAAIVALDDPLDNRSQPPPQDEPPMRTTQRIASRYAVGGDLVGVVGPESPLQTAALKRELHQWMAMELRVAARRLGCTRADLCDVTERTLNAWQKGDG